MEIHAEPAGVPGQPEGSAAALAGAVTTVAGNPVHGQWSPESGPEQGWGGGVALSRLPLGETSSRAATRGERFGTVFTNGFEPF